jgi:hypothetical protein
MRPQVFAVASAAALLSLVCLEGASAEGGCGPGFHRNAYGRCRPNEGPVVVAPAPPVAVAPAAPVIVAPAAPVVVAPAAPVVVAPAAPVVVAPAPVVVAPAPVVCGAGLRWHPRLRRCVVL